MNRLLKTLFAIVTIGLLLSAVGITAIVLTAGDPLGHAVVSINDHEVALSELSGNLPALALVGLVMAVVLVVVDLTIFASLLFAHLHLSMRAEVCPPPGAALPRGGAVWPALVLFGLGSLAVAFVARTRAKVDATANAWPLGSRVRASSGIGVALAATAAATFVLLAAQQGAGLEPARDAWSASVGALVAWQVFHAVVLALMALYLLARIWSGCLTDRSRATLDAITLFWHGVTVQGLIGLAVVQWLPRWLA